MPRETDGFILAARMPVRASVRQGPRREEASRPFTAGVSRSFRDTVDEVNIVTGPWGRVEVRHALFGVFLDAPDTRLGFDKVSIGPLPAPTPLFPREFGGAAQLAAGGEALWALDAQGRCRG